MMDQLPPELQGMSEDEIMAMMQQRGMGGMMGGMGMGGGSKTTKKKSRFKFKKPTEKPLHGAAKSGDLQALQQALANNSDLDERDGRDFTALAWAARSGHLNIVEALLEAGASIHGGSDIDEDAVSPLLAASATGHVDIVRMLLERGASVTTIDSILEHTPLHRAVDGGSKCSEVVTLLCTHEECKQAMLNKSDSSGFTPLCVAATTGSIDFCNVLIDAGASLTTVAEKGDTCLSVACKHSKLEVCGFVLFWQEDIFWLLTPFLLSSYVSFFTNRSLISCCPKVPWLIQNQFTKVLNEKTKTIKCYTN
jgi:ankyrin repeat protein